MRPGPAAVFRYTGHRIDADAGALLCHYELDGHPFVERVTAGSGDWDAPAVREAARLLYLLAGVSYYKAGAPPVIDLGATPVRAGEVALLTDFYVHGLGELAYRNGLDLDGLRITGGEAAGPPAPYDPSPGRPLVPFGGGIDSIVALEAVRAVADPTLFVLSREGDRFAAIEDAAAVTGLPVARAGRSLDPEILRSAAHGWINGHVPVTGILSAVALLVAVLGGHDAVVMSNEWSASRGTLVEGGVEVNHQWSKGAAFEDALRAALDAGYTHPPAYFSLLRPYSELWVARRFADLERYHPVFRSCNRAFHVDPAARLDHWCGRCDKCCFIDLILAPYLPAAALADVFDGAEPLEDPALLPRFGALLGRSAAKPFECVGDVEECTVAAALAAARPDRAGNPVLGHLAATAAGPTAGAAPSATGAPLTGGPISVPDPVAAARRLLTPLGPTNTPPRYAPPDRLV